MTAPGTTYPAGLHAAAWIYASSHQGTSGVWQPPGYRQIQMGSTTRTLTGAGYGQPMWPWELLDALDTAITPDGWSVAISGDSFELSGPSLSVSWPDRLGWLLGFDAEPGDLEPAATVLTPRAASPMIVPLVSCARPEGETIESEVSARADRFGRGHGWAYGAARLVRLEVALDRRGFEALDTGWAISGGPVIVSSADLAAHAAGTPLPRSASQPSGYIRARILREEGGRWTDERGAKQFYRTTLILAQEG